jgi:hypothetical protein
MEQGTIVLVILVIVILAIAAFSYTGSTGGLRTDPPNPNAEFGVVHEQTSFFGSGGWSGISTQKEPEPTILPVGPTNLELARKYVSLSLKNARSSRDPNSEYIQIAYSSSATDPINISNWTVSNIRGESFRLGQITKLPGITTTPNQDQLIISKGSRVNVITGRSPQGESFRANKCMSYLNQFKKFVPSLPGSCPAPNKEPGQEGLTDTCYTYVKNLSSCRMPTSPPFYIDNQCREFITKIASYNACITNHKNDTDFYLNDYWVYLDRPTQLWSDIRETITLKNERGEIVKTYSYQ